jgi:serine/threonine protein phosphatase PrpC
MLAAGSGESGTTVALLAVLGDRALVVNAGDSRVYRLDGGGAEVLSHDHSLVQSLVDHGHIGPGDVPGHPYRHVVEFGLGPPFERTWRKSGEHCHVREIPARPGDTFLLCTDGVNDTLTDEEIGRRLSPPDADALTTLARHLAERARDNFTAVLVRLPGGPGRAAGTSRRPSPRRPRRTPAPLLIMTGPGRCPSC